MTRLSLYSRLVGSYVVSLAVALLLFAVLAVLAIDATLRSSLNARLEAVARAAASTIAWHDKRLAIDSDDRAQLLALLGVDVDGAVLDRSGAVVMSTSSNVPRPVLAEKKITQASFASLGSGHDALQAYAMPVVRNNMQLGTIVIWRPDDWIEQIDREAALSFGIGALVVSVLGWVFGGRITRGALDDAVKRERRFTADASHDLRAPLAVIRAECELALRRERDPASYRESLTAIATETTRMERLVDDLLAAARADMGALKRERVSIDEVASNAGARLEPLAHVHGLRMETHCTSNASITADREALERAVIAIVHNAVKAAPRGTRVSIDTRRRGGRAEIVVADAGRGFSAEALRHAVERFWRADRSRETAGSGLGLAIANAIVQASGGTVELENGVAGGAVVRVAFRLQ